MKWFLSVTSKDNTYLYKDQIFDTLDTALSHISENYLVDCPIPYRSNGHFVLRSGEIVWLKINRSTAGMFLRDDIDSIDLLSARGKLEFDTYSPP